MTEIDDATGLPKLPEGHFWRVGENSVSIRLGLEDMEWSTRHPADDYFYINANGYSYRVETRYVEAEVVRQSWSGRAVKSIEQVAEYRCVERSIRVVEVFTEYTWETVPENYYSYMCGTRPQRVYKKVTRENLMGLCGEALAELDGISLCGDYPPKRLS